MKFINIAASLALLYAAVAYGSCETESSLEEIKAAFDSTDHGSWILNSEKFT